MKTIKLLFVLFFFSGFCFAQSNNQEQKKEIVKNKEAATLKNNNVSSAKNNKENATDDELINQREQNKIPGIMNGVYKVEPQKVLPVEVERTAINVNDSLEKIVEIKKK